MLSIRERRLLLAFECSSSLSVCCQCQLSDSGSRLERASKAVQGPGGAAGRGVGEGEGNEAGCVMYSCLCHFVFLCLGDGG